nr:uncharacterized protein LOC107451358 [Parasteatoda tepidariorum]
MATIKVDQINLHNSIAASSLMAKRLNDGELDIALIQEPWTRKGRIMGLNVKGFNIFYDTRCDLPRTCIVARSNLNALNLVNFLNRDLVAVKLKFYDNKTISDFVIASAYLPYEEKDPLAVITRALIVHCSSSCRFIFGCDANAHHTVWGSSNCNQRGDVLMEHILVFNLYVLNKCNEPTFVTCNRREVIDLTLCNSSSVDYVNDWKVSGAVTASDHQLITFSIKGLSGLKVVRRNPRTADWGSFRAALERKIWSFSGKYNNVNDVEWTVDQVQQIILDSHHISCQVTSTSSPRRVPWWSSELSKLRKKCRKFFNRAKKSGEWQSYRNALTAYNKAIRASTRCSWQTFCDGINTTSATAKIAKNLTKDFNCSLNAIRLTNGRYSESGEEALGEILEAHFPGSHPVENENLHIITTTTCSRNDWEAAKIVVSYEKVVWAIKSFKPYKSPGMDNIKPMMLIQGVNTLAPIHPLGEFFDPV